MIKKTSKPYRSLLLAVAVGGLMLPSVSCSDGTEDDGRLPEGLYPVTFTATVDGQTVKSRATTDNMWSGGEEVAVQIGGVVKKYTVSSGGSLTAASGETPFYWQSPAESKRVSAWYSSGYSAAAPTEFSVLTDQRSTGYQASDFLYAAPQDLAFQSGGVSSVLTFRHLPARVIVNLRNGNQLTEQEVSNATVSIVNQATTSGAIADDGTVAQAAAGSSEVSPAVLSAVASGFQKSVQALLVPQQMQGRPFIKVTVGTGDAARDYYYTPAGSTDASLEAGRQYSYNITVTKEGLQVTVADNGVAWTDSPVTATPDDGFAFHITAPAGVTIAAASGSGGTLSGSDGRYTLAGGSSVTISSNGARIGVKGLYDVAPDAVTYTLKSDLLITYTLNGAQAGDFYCRDADGNGYLIPHDVASLTDAQKAGCLGIVYWLGDITGDKYGLLDSKFPNGTHGLVVSLWDMPDRDNTNGTVSYIMTWTYGGYEFVNNWLGNATWTGSISRPASFTSIQVTDKKQGYANAVALKEYNKYIENHTPTEGEFPGNYGPTGLLRVKPVRGLAAFQTAHPVPSGSSGWYWPSINELQSVYWEKGMLNTQIGKVNGTTFGVNYYWSSTESSSGDEGARDVDFSSGGTSTGAKDSDYSYVRPLLAF